MVIDGPPKHWQKRANIGLALASVFAIVTVACTPSYKQLDYPVLPEELKDCKIFRINNSAGTFLYVVRCPNSSTSTTFHSGKSTTTTTVVDPD